MTSTALSWHKAPNYKHQFQGAVAGQEVQAIQGDLQQGEDGDDHPVPHPVKIIFLVRSGERRHGEVGRDKEDDDRPQSVHGGHYEGEKLSLNFATICLELLQT